MNPIHSSPRNSGIDAHHPTAPESRNVGVSGSNARSLSPSVALVDDEAARRDSLHQSLELMNYTSTVFESLAVPPEPVQVNVNVVLADSGALAALPLVALEPDQPPPDALHELAFVLVHETCVVAPIATLVGLSVTRTVGAVGDVCVVAFAGADCGDSLRFGLMRSNAVTV